MPGFSPDRLLNEAQPGSQYEKLGSEEINGHATTKYRVTLGGQEPSANSASSETIIWVDESLGMPIKSETTSKSGTNDQTRYTMEVQDVKSDVDPVMFQVPSDFKKVDYNEIRTQMYSNGASETKHP
jgi:outer membrane lipoprotein-sorting protein